MRTGSDMVTAPQVYRSRVILQSLDNYVYCLVADNGHEVWRAQASHRLTRPAAFWNDRVLLIPETSATVQVFDLYDGSDAGKWSLPDPDDYFTGAPLVMGDTAVLPWPTSSTITWAAVVVFPVPGGPWMHKQVASISRTT